MSDTSINANIGDLTSDSSLDAALEALKSPTEPGGNEPSATKAEATPSVPQTESSQGPDGVPPTDPASPPEGEKSTLELLEELEKTPQAQPQTPQAPQLTTEQQQILNTFKTPQEAQQAQTNLQGYANFTNAFAKGDFDAVEQMFGAWNPQAFENFMEHLYNKRVANGEWVDRWISEKEGRGGESAQLRQLMSTVQNLQAQLQNRQLSESQQQQAQSQKQAIASYQSHLNKRFDDIKFSPNDRRWVANDITARVANDPNLLNAINRGDLSGVDKVFSSAVREYIQRDQQQSTQTNAKVAAQNAKKAPLQGGSVTQSAALPTNVKEVAKGQEDAWMDQELGKLFASTRGKK